MILEETIVRWRRGAAPESVRDRVAVEEPLAVAVDGRVVTITMRTPGHDTELAAGFLVSEGIVRAPADLKLEASGENRVDATLAPGHQIDFDKMSRHVFGSSSCGLCGKTAVDRVRLPFDPVQFELRVRVETLLRLPELLMAAQATFATTGGLHAAGLFTSEGKLLAAREDIGRHNAVDKLLGYGLLNGLLPFSNHILLVSSRASFEILQKALAAGFPIVAAVSAPSSLAVQFARETGQTLVGFLRGERMNVYAGVERIDFG